MKCPTGCEATLVMSERQGVEIDYCPTCRGVWLDRGELDKILERSATDTGVPAVAPAPLPAVASPAPPPPQAGWQQPQVATHRYVDPGSPPPGYGSGTPRKKRKGFLEDIFDF